MRVGIVTGDGRAFCAGADLKGEFSLAGWLAGSLSLSKR